MALSNDRELFETYLAPVLKSAYGTVFYLIPDSEEAEALVQEAVIRAFERFHLYKPGSNFAVWFLGVLMETFCQKSRREDVAVLSETLNQLPDAEWLDEQEQSARPLLNEPSDALFASLTEQQIAVAFSQLPESVRAITALYFMVDLTYQQISDILVCPLQKVRTSLHCGRWMLHHLLCAIARGIDGRAACETRALAL